MVLFKTRENSTAFCNDRFNQNLVLFFRDYRSLYAHDRTFRLLYVRGHTNLSTYTLGLTGGFLAYYWHKIGKNFDEFKVTTGAVSPFGKSTASLKFKFNSMPLEKSTIQSPKCQALGVFDCFVPKTKRKESYFPNQV